MIQSWIQRVEHSALWRYVFSALSGLLLVISFPKTGSFFPLTFVSLVPLLLVANVLSSKHAWHLFGHGYLTFFIYNFGCTYWVYNASPGGGLMAFFCNSLLYALTMVVFQYVHKRVSSRWFSLALACVYVSFEFLHLNWDLSWPWLHLGNVFATAPFVVQWYAITGVLGGSFWILILNGEITHFLLLRNKSLIRRLTLLLLVPFLVSCTWYLLKNTGDPNYELVIVQPNTDPFNDKFTGNDIEQFKRFVGLSEKMVTDNTQLVIGPETAFFPSAYNSFVHDKMNQSKVGQLVKNLTPGWKRAKLFIGLSTIQFYDHKRSSVTRFDDASGRFYEYYNSSVYFGDKKMQLVKKSKRVLGVELIPFADYIPFFETLSINLGGSSGTLGIEDGYKIIKTPTANFTPCVCYESVYGAFVAKQSSLGSDFIAIITNDAWWGDTPGYKQHFEFARLRAIETNKWVVRSGNTGISGVINNRGEVLQKTDYWKQDVLRAKIPLMRGNTLYMILGDFIGWISVLGSILLFIFFRKK
jgi:apolipoprotein N-acyltransferase